MVWPVKHDMFKSLVRLVADLFVSTANPDPAPLQDLALAPDEEIEDGYEPRELPRGH